MNMLSGRVLSRRTMLRGAGYAVGLPFLDAMTPRRAHAQAAVPPRFLAVFAPCGFRRQAWTTIDSGVNFTMPAPMASLDALRPHITLLSDMQRSLYTGTGTHEVPTGNFLTSAPIEPGAAFGNNVSIDQVIAATRNEPFRSLELALEGGTSGLQLEYSGALVSSISYGGPNLLLPTEVAPLQLLRRVFTDAERPTNVAEAARQKRRERSILDAVLGDASRLNGQLDARDRARLDEHLTALRELERQLEVLEQQTVCIAPEAPGSGVTDRPREIRVMSDIALAAIRCGRTRVMTFMLGRGASFARYPFTASNRGHHELSHVDDQDPVAVAELVQIEIFLVEQYAYLLSELQRMDDGNGTTVLDNTFAMYGSEVADGYTHATIGHKIIIGGHAGGQLAGNQHIIASGQPTANVLLTAAQMCGVPLASFGDSTGPLAM
jgi:Protein of unknown function (DUF1552)